MMQHLYRYDSPWVFHERELHISLRDWISTWVDSLDKYIVIEGSSLIMQKKFLTMMQYSETLILKGITEFVLFFFQSRNIIISRSTTDSYSRFILANIRKSLENSLNTHPDKDMTQEEMVGDARLF